MPNIHVIFTHPLGNGVTGELGIDDQGSLYWNNKAVVTEKKVKLEWWVNISIILASASTVTVAIFTSLQFFGYGCNN